MKRGDLILYKSSGSIPDRLIAACTHGPYVHVAIMLTEALCIAALRSGINYDQLPYEDAQHIVISLNPRFDIEAGLAWAKQQIGKKYGWMDIVYQGFKFLAPNNPFQFSEKDHWDCSDFVTRYLMHIDYELPDAFSDPYCNTPNDIARLFGMLPPRKEARSA